MFDMSSTIKKSHAVNVLKSNNCLFFLLPKNHFYYIEYYLKVTYIETVLKYLYVHSLFLRNLVLCDLAPIFSISFPTVAVDKTHVLSILSHFQSYQHDRFFHTNMP